LEALGDGKSARELALGALGYALTELLGEAEGGDVFFVADVVVFGVEGFG
jgi:hypothetical protein